MASGVKCTVAEMIGELLRDAAVLVAVCAPLESIGKTKIDFRENGQAGFVAVTQREQNLSEAE